MHPIFLLLLFFLPSLTAEPCGDIANGCGAHGRCHLNTRSCGDNCNYRCICDTGFGGDDCSIRIDICPGKVSPDGARSCLHGGVCQLNGAEQWICDCANAKKGGKMYAGHQCEFVATASCEIDNDNSAHAFCTNGGTCRTKVESSQHHPMCFCADGFEGRHCQYAKGTVPDQETVYAIPPMPKNEGISGGAIGALIVLSLIFALGVAVFSMRPNSTKTVSVPNDLEMKASEEIDNHEADVAANEII